MIRYPSFSDSHVHFLGMGYQASIHDCHVYTEISKLIEALRPLVRNPFFIGRGWNQILFKEKRMLDKKDLNQISTHIPIILIRQCGHVACLNDAMLAYCQLTSSTKIKGFYDYDHGIVGEEALSKVLNCLPNPSDEQLLTYLKKADSICLANGITQVASDDLIQFNLPYSTIIKAFQDAYASNDLHVKITEQVHIRSVMELKKMLEENAFSIHNAHFAMGPIKLLADGSLGGKTAALIDGYEDDPSNHGIQYFTDQELYDIVLLADQNDLDVVIHAIGDKAAHQAIKALVTIIKQSKRSQHHHALIHAQVIQEEDLALMKTYHIGALIQPIFLNSDIEMAIDRLGKRIQKAYRFKDFYHLGLSVGFSTDSPIESVNPFNNVMCAMTQSSLNNPDLVLHPDQRFTFEEAMDCYHRHNRNFIKLPMNQDYIMISKNPETINAQELPTIEILETYVDGVCYYKKS